MGRMYTGELTWLGALETATAVRSGELDPQALVRTHLERIHRLDARIHAFICVDTEARAAETGALAGVTVAVKDTQPVAEML